MKRRRAKFNVNLLEADRQRAGLTTTEVAARCVPPSSQASISDLLNGKTASLGLLKRVAVVLGQDSHVRYLVLPKEPKS